MQTQRFHELQLRLKDLFELARHRFLSSLDPRSQQLSKPDGISAKLSVVSRFVQMAWSAASARALLAASPIASVEPTTIGERITEWLKITAVPLLVFLIGACIWSCIENTAAWRELAEDGGGSTRSEGMGGLRSDSPRANSNNEAAEDLETGLELPQVRCRDEGRDGSLKSSACCIATNAAMDGNIRPNSDIGDPAGC